MTSQLPDRTGLDPNFPGTRIPLPTPVTDGVSTVLLAYTHFSVLMRPDRRLAAITRVGIDGVSLREVKRADDWLTDPRLSTDQQTGEDLYADNDLDGRPPRAPPRPRLGHPRGGRAGQHRHVPVPELRPQAASFNQEMMLWLGLEDYLLDNAATFDRRLVVHRLRPGPRGPHLP